MVLYDKTLNEEEEDLAYYVPFLWTAGLGTLFYIVLFALPYMPSKTFESFKDPEFFRVVLNYVRLVIGSIAGLSFALLFGRYISMEHQLEKLAGTQYPKGMRLVFIIILPVYALVQPLFGNFHLKEFGDADMFANGIFLLCLLGKGFFFYVTWYFIKKKLMHYYLHLVLSTHGVPKNFDQCFKHTT
ncbi:MAG: hypothetical protein E8D40_08605 [Nitrospira sp.]|nr:MAG: hypothetical protein E8D40_08605 [Nitrospira sp.]